jgi:hypothetical protein
LKTKGLDGREYSWIPSNNIVETQHRSSLHSLAKKLLKNKYPYDRILEEVSLPGTNNLRADFFIPGRSLIVEVHGSQHTEFNNFFFKDKLSYYKAKARDSRKRNWCELNGLSLVELFHYETQEQWEEKI